MHEPAPPSFSSAASSAGKGRAFAALILSNICLAFGPLFVRLAEQGGVGAAGAAFWRVTLAVPFLLIVLKVSGERVGRLDRTLIALLAVAGLCFALDLGSWHLGILKTKLANATLFGNSTMLIFPIYGFIVARAWPSKSQAAALLLAAFGAALLMGRSYEASFDNLLGDLLCVLAGVFYTSYLIAMTRVRQTLAPWSALILSSIAGILPLLLITLAVGENLIPNDWTPLLALALISQVIGQGLITYALVHFQPIVIGVALLIQPVVSGTTGWLFYDERLGVLDFVGAIAVAVALVLVRRPERQAPPIAP